MLNQVQLNEFKRLVAQNKEKFNCCKKVFVISPPRNASTILSLLLNLNDKFSIYCESCIDDICNGYIYDRVSRMKDLAVSSKTTITDILQYCDKSSISYGDVIVYLFSRNKRMKKYLDNNWVIGDKTPYPCGKVKFIEYMNEEFNNNQFFGTIKKDLSLTLKSAIKTQTNNKKNTPEILISDSSIFIEEMVYYITALDEYMNRNILNNIYLYDYFDFVESPGKIVDSIYKMVLGDDNTFEIGIYNVDKYIVTINELLRDKYMGYVDHFVKINKDKEMILDSHQLGLVKNINKNEVHYKEDSQIDIYNEIIFLPDIKEKIREWDIIIDKLSFTRVS